MRRNHLKRSAVTTVALFAFLLVFAWGCDRSSAPTGSRGAGPLLAPPGKPAVSNSDGGAVRDKGVSPGVGAIGELPLGGRDTSQVKEDNSTVLDTVIITIVDTQIVFDVDCPQELIIDTVDCPKQFVIDTVEVVPELTGEWLRFSAYLFIRDHIRQNLPEYANDRFSSLGEYCDYGPGTPAGRAGFRFEDNGDGTFNVAGYIFRRLSGADGYIWDATAGKPAEETYSYSALITRLGGGNWEVNSLVVSPTGDYIRDTRHD